MGSISMTTKTSGGKCRLHVENTIAMKRGVGYGSSHTIASRGVGMTELALVVRTGWPLPAMIAAVPYV
jgi:hypothetical protein